MRGVPKQNATVFELFQASISQNQILLTILLGLVVCYWLMVILGVLDLETDVADGGVDGSFNTFFGH